MKFSPTGFPDGKCPSTRKVRWEKDGVVVIHPLGHDSFSRWHHIVLTLQDMGLTDWIWIGEDTIQWKKRFEYGRVKKDQ